MVGPGPETNHPNGVVVVKIGGSTLGSGDTSLRDLLEWQARENQVVVVHGGGKTITAWLTKHGIASRFVGGLRVTDTASLEIATAVLAGLVNKELVAQISALGGRAVGVSGADGGLIRARIKDPELGYVGEVEYVNPSLLRALTDAGYVPFVAPIGLGEGGQLLNINADTVAGDIAAALGAQRLIFLTDVPGILDGDGRLLRSLDAGSAIDLAKRGTISGGMLPKVEACLRARAGGARAQILDARAPGALLAALDGAPLGTMIE